MGTGTFNLIRWDTGTSVVVSPTIWGTRIVFRFGAMVRGMTLGVETQANTPFVILTRTSHGTPMNQIHPFCALYFATTGLDWTGGETKYASATMPRSGVKPHTSVPRSISATVGLTHAKNVSAAGPRMLQREADLIP